MKLLQIIRIIPKLGYKNVAYMVWYRLSMKLGWRKRKFPLGTATTGTFFKATAPIQNYPESWRSKTLEKDYFQETLKYLKKILALPEDDFYHYINKQKVEAKKYGINHIKFNID